MKRRKDISGLSVYIKDYDFDILHYFLSVVLRPNAGHGFLILELSVSRNDAPQSVGLL